MIDDRAALFAKADIVIQILSLWLQRRQPGKDDFPLLRRDQLLIGFLRPAGSRRNHTGHRRPRRDVVLGGVDATTTRAQSMDALSSMAHDLRIQGGAASPPTAMPRIFPMLTTAAGHHHARRACS